MKKIYYISILASLMASQSNFAAEDKEEKFLFTFLLKVKKIDMKTIVIFKNFLFISNKIKGSDIKIGQDEELHYGHKDKCDDGEYHFRKEINISDKNKIFGATSYFNQANPATIFTKDKITPFIDELLKNDKNTLLGDDSELDKIYKKEKLIEDIKNNPIEIISKNDDGALTEDFDTFKARNTPAQKPLNQDTSKLNTTSSSDPPNKKTSPSAQNSSNQELNPSEETNSSTQNPLNQETNKPTTTTTSAQNSSNQELNPSEETNPSTESPLNPSTSTESLWSRYQKPILTIITLAVLLGILYYMEVFSTLLSNDKKQNKSSKKSSSSAQA